MTLSLVCMIHPLCSWYYSHCSFRGQQIMDTGRQTGALMPQRVTACSDRWAVIKAELPLLQLCWDQTFLIPFERLQRGTHLCSNILIQSHLLSVHDSVYSKREGWGREGAWCFVSHQVNVSNGESVHSAPAADAQGHPGRTHTPPEVWLLSM